MWRKKIERIFVGITDTGGARWLSADPALGDYVPGAPVNDEARKRNGNLPGMGGVFNTVNFHLYHYAGNNPVKYTDPDGNSSEKYEQISRVEGSGSTIAGNGIGTGSTVNINLDTMGEILGGGSREPVSTIEATIAHEVSGHAYQNAKGKSDLFRLYYTNVNQGKRLSEYNATAIENQFRDSTGADQRITYSFKWGTERVPRYNSATGGWVLNGRPYSLR